MSGLEKEARPDPLPLAGEADAPLGQPSASGAAGAMGDALQARRGRRLRLHEMRVRHVLSCLARLKLEQYSASFEAHGIDGYMCDFLDDSILQHQLGMRVEEHRKRFLQWVEQMQVPPRRLHSTQALGAAGAALTTTSTT